MDSDILWFIFLYIFSTRIQDVRAEEDCLTLSDFYSECEPLTIDHGTVCYNEKFGFPIYSLTANVTCNEGYRLDKHVETMCEISYEYFYTEWNWNEDIPKCELVQKPMNPASEKQVGASTAAYVVPIVIIILVLVAIVIALLFWRRNRITAAQRSSGNSSRGRMTVNNQLYDDTTEIISEVTQSTRKTTISDIQTANGDNDQDRVGYDYENVQRPIPNGNNQTDVSNSEQQNNNDIAERTVSQDYDSDYENAFT